MQPSLESHVYTVWSKGRLLGHTTLDFCPCVTLESRMGWFEPTEAGERLMPALTNLGVYHEAISQEMTDGSFPSGEAIDPGRRVALAREALRYKVTEEAGLALDTLALELHDSDGVVVPTQYISLQDTEYLMALAGDDDECDDWQADVPTRPDEPDEPDEISAAFLELGIEEDLVMPDDWESGESEDAADWDDGPSTLPRYQIFVHLVDGHSLPVSDRWKDDPYVQSLIAGFDPFADGCDVEERR